VRNFGVHQLPGAKHVCDNPDWSQHDQISCFSLTDCVDLMDSSGRVMNLEAKQHSRDLASSVLTERRFYVPLQVLRHICCLTKTQRRTCFVAELLRKLSHPNKETDRKSKRRWTQKNKDRQQELMKSVFLN
uniref:Uncharacterized protein n=1 Tax=Oryzias latipes TaxID=8090 RepID=A0A3P9HRC1_ORYLA